MIPDFNKLQGRREFFRGFARYSILGGALIIGGVLSARQGQSRCERPVACRNCAAFQSCSLPQAQAARKQVS